LYPVVKCIVEVTVYMGGIFFSGGAGVNSSKTPFLMDNFFPRGEGTPPPPPFAHVWVTVLKMLFAKKKKQSSYTDSD
jgi:hypothetical protein